VVENQRVPLSDRAFCPFTEDAVRRIPEEHAGVYLVFAPTHADWSGHAYVGRALYIGAGALRAELLQALHRPDLAALGASHYVAIRTRPERVAELRSALVEEYRPTLSDA
jgi:hypothetical protein